MRAPIQLPSLSGLAQGDRTGDPRTLRLPIGANLRCGGATASPSPQSKSAVADFDRFIEWPKPAYTRFRLGEGWGGGSGGSAKAVHHSTTPTPNPSPQGGGEEFAAPPRRKLTPMPDLPLEGGGRAAPAGREGAAALRLPPYQGGGHHTPDFLRQSDPPAPGRTVAFGAPPQLPLPACHQGVYARLRRAMERVGVRGPLQTLGLWRGPLTRPHPNPPRQAGEGREGATSPRKRGEVKAAAKCDCPAPPGEGGQMRSPCPPRDHIRCPQQVLAWLTVGVLAARCLRSPPLAQAPFPSRFGSLTESFGAMIAAEIPKWAEAVRAAGLRLD